MINNMVIEEEIEKYKMYLKHAERELDKLKKSVTPGIKLYSMKKGNSYQYFMRTKPDETHGKYISKEKRKIAEVLAQIEYDENLVETLNKTVKYLEQLKRKMEKNPFLMAEQKLNYGKRELISRIYITDEEYVKAWSNEKYETMGFRETEKEYYTREGLRVRSKSEIIIADILNEEGIPFCYEKPLNLNSKMIHPDFTLLNIIEKKRYTGNILG